MGSRRGRRYKSSSDRQTKSRACYQWAILAVVNAARIERLRMLARTQSDVAADTEFTAHELRALTLMKRKYAKRTETIPDETPSMADAVRCLLSWAVMQVARQAVLQARSPFGVGSSSSRQSPSLSNCCRTRESCDECPVQSGAAPTCSGMPAPQRPGGVALASAVGVLRHQLALLQMFIQGGQERFTFYGSTGEWMWAVGTPRLGFGAWSAGNSDSWLHVLPFSIARSRSSLFRHEIARWNRTPARHQERSRIYLAPQLRWVYVAS
jgi:hypothetical protein